MRQNKAGIQRTQVTLSSVEMCNVSVGLSDCKLIVGKY